MRQRDFAGFRNRPAAHEAVAESVRGGHPAALIARRNVIAVFAQAVPQKLSRPGSAMHLVVAVFNTLVEETLRGLSATLFAIRRKTAIILQAMAQETASL